MAFLDEDELEPAHEPGGRRRGSQRQRQFLVRRLIAVGAGVLVVILAVIGVRGCLEARKERGFENYLRDLDSIASNARSLSNAFFTRLNNPGEDLTELDLQNQISSDRGTAEGLLQRVEGLDTPDELQGAQAELTFAFELRRDALAAIAEQIPTALGDQDPGRNRAFDTIANQMQALLASDVVYARARNGIRRVLNEEEIDTDGNVPQSQFLQDPVERYVNALQLHAILAGAVVPEDEAGVRGVELLSTTLDPDEVILTPDTLNTVELGNNLELSVEVQNSGEQRETEISVRYTISGAQEPIEGETTIDRISPAGSEAASLPIRPQPPPDTELTLTVTVSPVPGETLIENNESTYQLTFSG